MLPDQTCKVTVTANEFQWLRSIKCGDPVAERGLCARHVAQRNHLLEVGRMSAHLVLFSEGGDDAA